MSRKPVFYSFHFDKDVFRVQQIRNIGSLEGNNPVSPNRWENIKRAGDDAVKRWINENMKYKRCIIVLVGYETYNRPWVLYEIKKAWLDNKAMFGIYIHNMRCPRSGTCMRGPNPFDHLAFDNGEYLSRYVDCYDPNPRYAYRDIANNIDSWINRAIVRRDSR